MVTLREGVAHSVFLGGPQGLSGAQVRQKEGSRPPVKGLACASHLGLVSKGPHRRVREQHTLDQFPT